jgi:hypothetical protein
MSEVENKMLITGTQLRDKLDGMTGTSIVYEPDDFLVLKPARLLVTRAFELL